MDTPESRLARLEVMLENTLQQISGLKSDFEKYMDRVAAIQLIEDRYHRVEADMKLLSGKLTTQCEAFEDHKKEMGLKHQWYDRFIYTGSGIILVCTILWAIFGAYISNNISQMMTLLSQEKAVLMQHDMHDKEACPYNDPIHQK